MVVCLFVSFIVAADVLGNVVGLACCPFSPSQSGGICNTSIRADEAVHVQMDGQLEIYRRRNLFIQRLLIDLASLACLDPGYFHFHEMVGANTT